MNIENHSNIKSILSICTWYQAEIITIPSSLSVRIWPFQGRGRGSIPRRGNNFLLSLLVMHFSHCELHMLFTVQARGNLIGVRTEEVQGMNESSELFVRNCSISLMITRRKLIIIMMLR
jgi:hypothetical protein